MEPKSLRQGIFWSEYIFNANGVKKNSERNVTSGSRNKISLKFKKCAISNMSIQNGGPGRYRKSQRNTKKTPPPTAQERTLRHRSIPGIAVESPEDVPANSRTRGMAQKMKKLRSLHSLHVPPRKSKTR